MFIAAAFLTFCVICTVLAFVRHPIYGLYFYFAATYVFPPDRWWGYLFGETRWSLLAASVAILAVVFHRGKLQPKPLWLANAPAMVFAVYALWMWMQYPWVLDQETHFNASTQYVKYLVAFWLVYRVVDSEERVRDVLLAHVLGCGLLGIMAYMTGRTLGDRLDGVGGPGMDDANTLGMYFATGAIVGLGLVLTQSGWRRWLSLGCVVIIMEGLVLVNTRGAFLALVAGGLALALVKARMHRRLFWTLAVVGLLGVVSIVDQKFVDRMWSIEKLASNREDADTSARSRVVVIQAQWRMFLDYPMGTGHRGTETLSTRYLDREWLSIDASGDGARSSHNTFMTTLVEQGVPGAVLFLWLSLWTPLAMMRLRRLEPSHADPDLTTLAAGVFGALVVVFVAGNTADFLLAEVQFWLFATFVSILHLASLGAKAKTQTGRGTPTELKPYLKNGRRTAM